MQWIPSMGFDNYTLNAHLLDRGVINWSFAISSEAAFGAGI